MKHIQLSINMTDDLGIKSIDIDFNDTGLPSDSGLIKSIAIALLTAIEQNKDSLQLQDMLSELGIKIDRS